MKSRIADSTVSIGRSLFSSKPLMTHTDPKHGWYCRSVVDTKKGVQALLSFGQITRWTDLERTGANAIHDAVEAESICQLTAE